MASSSFLPKPIFTKGDSKLRSFEAFGELEGNGFANPRRQDVCVDWIQALYVLYRYIRNDRVPLRLLEGSLLGVEFARPSDAPETFPASFTIEDKASSFCREKACQKLRDTRLEIYNLWSTIRNERTRFHLRFRSFFFRHRYVFNFLLD